MSKINLDIHREDLITLILSYTFNTYSTEEMRRVSWDLNIAKYGEIVVAKNYGYIICDWKFDYLLLARASTSNLQKIFAKCKSSPFRLNRSTTIVEGVS